MIQVTAPAKYYFADALSPGALGAHLAGFAGFAADTLALEDYAFAQVRLRLLQLAYLRGYLAHGLLVYPRHAEAGRGVHVESDTGGRLDPHGVREAEREHQSAAVF